MFPLVQLSLSPDPRRTMTECVSPFPLQPKREKQCYLGVKHLNKGARKGYKVSFLHKRFYAICFVLFEALLALVTCTFAVSLRAT